MLPSSGENDFDDTQVAGQECRGWLWAQEAEVELLSESVTGRGVWDLPGQAFANIPKQLGEHFYW